MSEDTNTEQSPLPEEAATEVRRGRKPAKDSAEVTYIPGEGDPIKTKVHGVEFRGNVPVSIRFDKMVETLTRKETKGPEGETRSRGVEGKISLVELLRGNRCFSVDGVHPEHKEGARGIPKDADGDWYRGYAMKWINESTTFAQLEQRWAGEQALREKCGLEPKDENYLRPFFEFRKDQLRGAA
jgi:hypothetical protein